MCRPLYTDMNLFTRYKLKGSHLLNDPDLLLPGLFILLTWSVNAVIMLKFRAETHYRTF